jgi:hypothetical protein
VHSASGNTAEGLLLIEEGIEDYRTTNLQFQARLRRQRHRERKRKAGMVAAEIWLPQLRQVFEKVGFQTP